MNKRSAAVLLPLTSLPDEAPIGLIGKEAYHFIDKLSEAGIEYWQMLPVHFFDKEGCPYASPGAFGGNPLLLSIEEIDNKISYLPHNINFEELYRYKNPLLDDWAMNYLQDHREEVYQKVEAFKEKYSWVHDLAIFLTLRETFGNYWTKWPKEYLDFEKAELDVLGKDALSEIYLTQVILQCEFHEKWNKLKDYASSKNVKLIGDIPIFVSAESFDTWRWRSLFKMNQDTGIPHVVTGAPPDDFSEDGQLWGTVNYAWNNPEVLDDIIAWWIKRLEYSLDLFDLIRIDHFIGIYHVWESPEGEKTAAKGHWVNGNGEALLSAIKKHFPEMPFIAEDLGDLSQEVCDLRDKYELPTMKVFQFSINDRPDNQHLPSLVPKECCYFTGTHDNSTLMGWLHENMTDDKFVKQFHQRFGVIPTPQNEEEIRKLIINKVVQSQAKLVVIPIQDIFALDASARINVPGTEEGNWKWRLSPDQWDESLWRDFTSTLAEGSRLGNQAQRDKESP